MPTAYNLYNLLPQNIIDQTNNHLKKKGKQELDIEVDTTGHQFYQLLRTAVKMAHKKTMIVMSFTRSLLLIQNICTKH